MNEKQPDRFQIGRTIALSGVVFVISFAVLIMMLLAVMLMPQIFPTLFSPPITVSIIFS